MAKKKEVFLKSKKKNGFEKNKGRTREKRVCNTIIEQEMKESEKLLKIEE
jgi:hypothetical protein